MRTGRIFSSLKKVTTVQSGDVDRSTDLLETETVERLAQLCGKESSLNVPVFAFSYTAGGRAPVLSFAVSLGTVLSLTGLKCSAHSFMVISASFGILYADNEVINLAALSGMCNFLPSHLHFLSDHSPLERLVPCRLGHRL